MQNISNICHLTPALPYVDVFKHVFSVIFQIKDKLDDIETKLMDRRPEDLQSQIEALKKKTEQNRKMARDAREAADSALENATDTVKVRFLKTELNSWLH